MENVPVIKTERLVLRAWCEADLEPFHQLNADPEVRRFFPSLLSRKESDQQAALIQQEIEEKGYGFFAASLTGLSDFIGFIGIRQVDFPSHFTPAYEIGWRLARKHWGQGLATEGAKAVLQYGFSSLKMDEIVSFAVEDNWRSRRVMEKIGMSYHQKDDFDHPDFLPGDPLRRHVLYRIKTGFFTTVFEELPLNFSPTVEAAGCFIECQGRTLYMERAKNTLEGGTWGIPAGKIEGRETPLIAAKRELFEETGIVAPLDKIHQVGPLFVQKPRGDFVFHLFQVSFDEIPEVILSNEHVKYAWLKEDEIFTLPTIGGGKETYNYYCKWKKRVAKL